MADKKFLDEGIDYMDAAVELENVKNKTYEKYAGKHLTDRTLNELMYLVDPGQSSKEIGKYLSTTYKQEQFDAFISGLVKGFKASKEVDAFEDEEKVRLKKLFENFGSKD